MGNAFTFCKQKLCCTRKPADLNMDEQIIFMGSQTPLGTDDHDKGDMPLQHMWDQKQTDYEKIVQIATECIVKNQKDLTQNAGMAQQIRNQNRVKCALDALTQEKQKPVVFLELSTWDDTSEKNMRPEKANLNETSILNFSEDIKEDEPEDEVYNDVSKRLERGYQLYYSKDKSKQLLVNKFLLMKEDIETLKAYLTSLYNSKVIHPGKQLQKRFENVIEFRSIQIQKLKGQRLQLMRQISRDSKGSLSCKNQRHRQKYQDKQQDKHLPQLLKLDKHIHLQEHMRIDSVNQLQQHQKYLYIEQMRFKQIIKQVEMIIDHQFYHYAIMKSQSTEQLDISEPLSYSN